MPPTLAAATVDLYCRTHDRLLKLARDLTDEQLHWRPLPESHAIAFHLWHVARWADYLHAVIPGMTPHLHQQLSASPQIWESAAIGAQWGFSSAQLGYAQTGKYMDNAAAVKLPFPDKDRLLAYVEAAFVAAELAVRSIDEEQLHAPEQRQPLTEGIWSEGTVGSSILDNLVHESRHLGMIEYLLGLQIGSGTATV